MSGSCLLLAAGLLSTAGDWTCEWLVGQGEQCLDARKRRVEPQGTWGMGARGLRHTRKSWPASLISLQSIQPPARLTGATDFTFTDVRGGILLYF